jgi:hypothetical protein
VGAVDATADRDVSGASSGLITRFAAIWPAWSQLRLEFAGKTVAGEGRQETAGKRGRSFGLLDGEVEYAAARSGETKVDLALLVHTALVAGDPGIEDWGICTGERDEAHAEDRRAGDANDDHGVRLIDRKFKVKLLAKAPPGLAGKLCWKSGTGAVPGAPVSNSGRRLISMIGWVWYAALTTWITDPTGSGSGAQIRVLAAAGDEPLTS